MQAIVWALHHGHLVFASPGGGAASDLWGVVTDPWRVVTDPGGKNIDF